MLRRAASWAIVALWTLVLLVAVVALGVAFVLMAACDLIDGQGWADNGRKI